MASLPARRGTSLLSPEAANRSLVNWGEEVVSVLQEDPLVPGGLHFDAIQKRLALRGYERKWFELRTPLKTLLKRGVTRRTLVTLESDTAFIEAVRQKYKVAEERRREERRQREAQAPRPRMRSPFPHSPGRRFLSAKTPPGKQKQKRSGGASAKGSCHK